MAEFLARTKVAADRGQALDPWSDASLARPGAHVSGGQHRFNSRQSGAVGEVAERFKAAVLKTVEPERVPGVRIPPSPPVQPDK